MTTHYKSYQWIATALSGFILFRLTPEYDRVNGSTCLLVV